MQQLSYRMPRLILYRQHVLRKIEDVSRRPAGRRMRRKLSRKIPVTHPIEVKEKIEVEPKGAPALSPYMVDRTLVDEAAAAVGTLIHGPVAVYQYSQLTWTSRYNPPALELARDRLRQLDAKAASLYASLAAIMRHFLDDVGTAAGKLKSDSIRTLKQVAPALSLSAISHNQVLRKARSWSVAAVPVIVITLLGMHVLDKPETSPQNTPALPQTAFDRPAPGEEVAGDQTTDGQDQSSGTAGNDSSNASLPSPSVNTSPSAESSVPSSHDDISSSSGGSLSEPETQPSVGGFGGNTDWGSNAPAAPAPSETEEPPEEPAPAPEEPAGIITVPGQTIEVGDIEVLQTPDITL